MKTKSFLREYKSIASAFAGIFLCIGLNANAADEIIIDLFTSGQVAADVNNGGSGDVQSTLTGISSIMGGQRDINANALTGTEDLNANGVCDVGDKCSVMSISGGVLDFSNDTSKFGGVVGEGIFQWDGDDQSINLVPDGMGIDLTDGGLASSITVTTLFADQSFIFVIEAYTDDTHYTKVKIQSDVVVGGIPSIRSIPFAVLEDPSLCGHPELTGDPQVLAFDCGVGNVDFTNLGAMQVLLNIPNDQGIRVSALDLTLSAIVGPKDTPLACRLTGGGVTTDSTYDSATGETTEYLVWDGTMAEQSDYANRYQFGGQAGANTALPPQPKGEWTHHQQSGPAGSFTFHTGTASAPMGTEIVEIRCTDPGGCFPSGNPPSPNKQLDFDCVGTFKNIGTGVKKAPKWMLNDANVTAEGNGNQAFDGTFHYCQVNVDDNGEGPAAAAPDSEACPSEGFGEKGVAGGSNCDCDDFYRITIYNGVDASIVTWLEDGSIDPLSLNTTDVLYEVEGYLGKGGNGLQLHDLTGFDK